MAITIPKNIQERLGIDGTEELLNFILEEQRKNKEELTKDYQNEDEKRELRIERKLEELKGSLEKRIEEVKGSLETKIEGTKFDILKWLIAMWITLIIAMGIFKIL